VSPQPWRQFEPLLPGGRFGTELRYASPLRLLGTANGARVHRICSGTARILVRATYEAQACARTASGVAP
jgi:hypothetical protein